MTHKSSLLAAALAAVVSGQAFAGPTDHPAVERGRAHTKAQAQDLRSTDDDDFSARDLIVDADGTEHVRFDRKHKGLRVLGGDAVVHTARSGKFKAASHTLRDTLRVDTDARFSSQDAVRYASSLFKGQQDGQGDAELIVYARTDTPSLAYDVTIKGVNHEGTPSVLHQIIDANSLQVLDSFDEVMTATSTGTAATLLSGSVSITTDSTTTGFALRDPTRGKFYTTDLKGGTSGVGTLFTDTDNLWGTGSTTSRVTVGTDAHYGLTKTWDYYKVKFGRNGIDNAGSTTYSRVHYSSNYVNAFWSDTCFCMTYGDGDGVTYLPLVALDVAAHEMSHGVTSRTAKLVYSGESGGLNEANSDIFGTLVEYYVNSPVNPPNYLIGERIFKANNGVVTPTKALRYMFKPSIDGKSPDCYSSTLGTLDVHYSSGVANHFFYLLAEGAKAPAGFTQYTPSQLVCNGNTALVALGRDVAAQIWYRALTVYMTSSTKYAGARTATLKAAADLYGSTSQAYASVAAAWSAVSVN